MAADRRRKAQARRGAGRRTWGRVSSGIKLSSFRRSLGLKIAGWTTVGIGAVGLIVGGVLAGLASSKANELEDIVKAGNPTMDKPTVSYSKEHHDMVVSYDSLNKGGVGTLVAGGVLAGPGAVLLIINAVSGGKKKADAGTTRVVIAPSINSQNFGLTGQVSF